MDRTLWYEKNVTLTEYIALNSSIIDALLALYYMQKVQFYC